MKRSEQAPAEIGEVIVIPLEDRRWGIAHVVATKGSSAGVVMLDYVGAKPRSIDDVPKKKAYLREPSLSRTGMLDGPPVVAARWVSAPLPPQFVRVGVCTPSAGQTKVSITTYAGGWANVASTILIVWLRANNPEKAEALLESWRATRAKVERAHAKKEEARRANLTLAQLSRATPLAAWSKRHSAKVVTAARQILRDVAREIAGLGEKGASRARTEALRRGVERFNVLDGKNGLRMLTTEREDLCAAFLDITRAAKMRTGPDPTERWRDW